MRITPTPNVQTLSLQQIYREEADFKLYIHQVIAIAFVPPVFVRLAWRGYKKTSCDRSQFNATGCKRAFKKKKQVQKPREQTENY